VLAGLARLARTLGLSRAGAWTGAAFVLASNLFYFNARRPMTDLPALAFGTAGMVLMLERRGALGSLVAGALFGASALAKLTGPLPFVLALAMLAWDRRFRPTSRAIGLAILAAVVVLAPWHVYMVLEHGSQFLDVYVGYHLLERASRAVVGSAGETTYLAWLVEREGVIGLLLVGGLVSAAVGAARRERASLAALSLLLGASLPLALAETALPHYLTLAIPAAALLVAVFSDRMHAIGQRLGRGPGPAIRAALFLIAAIAFSANNGRDLLDPDYGPGTKAACARLRREAEPLAGTYDLHDLCAIWYCDSPVVLFADDPGYRRAVQDIPALNGMVRAFTRETIRKLASDRAALLARPDRVAALEAAARRAGVQVQRVESWPDRVLVRLGPTASAGSGPLDRSNPQDP